MSAAREACIQPLVALASQPDHGLGGRGTTESARTARVGQVFEPLDHGPGAALPLLDRGQQGPGCGAGRPPAVRMGGRARSGLRQVCVVRAAKLFLDAAEPLALLDRVRERATRVAEPGLLGESRRERLADRSRDLIADVVVTPAGRCGIIGVDERPAGKAHFKRAQETGIARYRLVNEAQEREQCERSRVRGRAVDKAR